MTGSLMRDAQGAPEANDPQPGRMFNDIVRSTATGVPIVGGLLNKIDAATNAALAPLLNPLFDPKDQLAEPTFGERYAHALRDQEGADQRFSTEHPVVDTAAKLTGGIASMAPVMAAAPWTFGVGGTLPGMVGRSAIAGATLGGADAAARGQDIPRAALYGGIFGAALPATGRAVGALVSPARTTAAANAIADSATQRQARAKRPPAQQPPIRQPRCPRTPQLLSLTIKVPSRLQIELPSFIMCSTRLREGCEPL
jgi:hypothetical protein